MRRPAEGERELLEAAELDREVGVVGDRWSAGRTNGRAPNPATQVTLMSARAAALVARTRDRWPLAGDQLYVDLDISEENLPAGTRLRLGSAVLEISHEPHTGCKKFVARFGMDAMLFVNSPVGRALRLRGVNARVVEPGTVSLGDAVDEARAEPPPDHGARLGLGRARDGRAAARAARERRARGSARRHGHVRALGRPPPLRRVPPRSGRLRPRLRGRDARDRRARGRRRRAAAVVVRPAGLAEHRDRFPVPVLVSRPETIRRSNDKAESYALLHRLGVPAPQFRRVRGAAEVEAAARELGYPERPVCFKPVFSSGSRGFRVLDPTVDRAHQLLHERPGSVAMRLEEAVELLPAEGGPDLLVMELATGRRAHDRRHRRRPPRRARPPEDARVDARGAGDVLRHARRRRR